MIAETFLFLDRQQRRAKEWWCEKRSHRWITAPSKTFRICARCTKRQVRR